MSHDLAARTAAAALPVRSLANRAARSIRRWLRLAVAGLIAASLLGWLGKWWWGFDLLAHFRVQYAALFVVLGGLMLMTRDRRAVLWVAVFLVVEVAAISPLLCRCGEQPAGGPTRLRLVQQNLNAGNHRWPAIAAFLLATDADLILLHEVTPACLTGLVPLLTGYSVAVADPRQDPFGIALCVRTGMAPRVTLEHVELRPVPVRGLGAIGWIVADLSIEDRPARLLGVRMPPPVSGAMAADRDRLIADAAVWSQAQTAPVLLCGDFNATRWSAPMRDFRLHTGLLDAQRGGGMNPTWLADTPFAITIDQTFYSRDLAVQRSVGPDIGSDHRGQILEVGWSDAAEAPPPR